MLVYWLLDIGSRATQHLALTPQERAVLRLIDSLLIGALVAAVVAVAPLLVGQQVPDARVILSLGGAAFLQALVNAILKLIRAQADPLLPGAAESGQADVVPHG